MDFELSDEQNMLKDSVDRFVRDTREQTDAAAGGLDGFSCENWKMFAEMGWLALPFAEENGGLDGTIVDVCVLTEALGGGLGTEPFLSTVMLGGRLVEELGNADQKVAILPDLIEGNMTLALACTERQSRADILDVETQASPQGDGYVLNGYKSVVLNGDSADKIIVVARTSGDRCDPDGLSLFILDKDVPGVTMTSARTLEGQRVSDIVLQNVTVGAGSILGTPGRGADALEKVVSQATIAVCATAVGAMRRVNTMTGDFAQQRQQFGMAIGDNQVVQHRLVDMFVAAEECKSVTDLAAMKAAENAPDWRRYVSAAKAKVAVSGTFVGAQGVQLHGGIGMTDEYAVGRLYKKLMTAAVLFGDQDHHFRRMRELEKQEGTAK